GRSVATLSGSHRSAGAAIWNAASPGWTGDPHGFHFARCRRTGNRQRVGVGDFGALKRSYRTGVLARRLSNEQNSAMETDQMDSPPMVQPTTRQFVDSIWAAAHRTSALGCAGPQGQALGRA